jgi:diguanylate cyclase (GGDEF)-like protein
MATSVTLRFEELRSDGMLPSPHGVAQAVLEMTRRPDASIQNITPLVQMDPAMAGRMLRYANAAHGGSLRHIASLKQAITFLGLFRVRQIALAFSLIDQYRAGTCPSFDYAGYWTTSLATGIAAQELAPLAHSPPDESFTCGLLSGIGRLAIATVYPDQYAELLRLDLTGNSMCNEELTRFGIDHATLSAEMLLGWGLPDIFANAVRHHEQPADIPFTPGSRAHTLTMSLYFAMRIGQLLNLDETQRWDQVPALYHAAAQLGIEEADVPPLVERVMVGWQGWAKELKLPTRTHPDLRALLSSPPVSMSKPDMSALMILPLRVVLMVRDPGRLQALAKTLEAMGLQSESASDITGICRLLRENTPDVAIIDVGGSSDEAIEQLRMLRDEAGNSLHCIALIPTEAEGDAPRLMLAGASDYLLYNASEAALTARLSTAQQLLSLQGAVKAERELAVSTAGEWARTNRRLLHEALTDPLTQIPNRRYGMDRFAQEWSIASSSDLPMACLMLDIDHFKRVNDQRGHDVGDLVLRQVAEIVERSCRRGDIVFRYGGEEFCVISPSTGLREGLNLGERITGAVRSSHFGKPEDRFQITLSIGVAVRKAEMLGPDNLISMADGALYAAKDNGRDRVSAA